MALLSGTFEKLPGTGLQDDLCPLSDSGNDLVYDPAGNVGPLGASGARGAAETAFVKRRFEELLSLPLHFQLIRLFPLLILLPLLAHAQLLVFLLFLPPLSLLLLLLLALFLQLALTSLSFIADNGRIKAFKRRLFTLIGFSTPGRSRLWVRRNLEEQRASDQQPGLHRIEGGEDTLRGSNLARSSACTRGTGHMLCVQRLPDTDQHASMCVARLKGAASR